MIAQELLASLQSRGETLAVAESVTGGAISKAITDVP
ncbi:MAG: CinA family protein, partial [bacterium]